MKKTESKINMDKTNTKKPISNSKPLNSDKKNAAVSNKTNVAIKSEVKYNQDKTGNKTPVVSSKKVDEKQISKKPEVKSNSAKTGNKTTTVITNQNELKNNKSVSKSSSTKVNKTNVNKPKSAKSNFEKYGFEKAKFYTINDAVSLAKKMSTTKFVSSIDLAIKLNVDTSKSEQQLRGTLTLPYHFGKSRKILVLDKGLTQKDASKLGVDFAGDSEKIAEISKGWLDFDLIITTPKMMPELSKLGKILGTRGLMPNPKTGNVTTDLPKTIAEFKKGITQYRTDSYGNIHMTVGKVDAEDKKVAENIQFIIDFINSKRPSTVKGIFIEKVSISSTMGPGIKILVNKSDDKKSKKSSKSKSGVVLGNNEVKNVYYKPVYKYTRKPKPSKNPENPPVIVEENKKSKPKKTFVKIKKTTKKSTPSKPVITKKPIDKKNIKKPALKMNALKSKSKANSKSKNSKSKK